MQKVVEAGACENMPLCDVTILVALLAPGVTLLSWV